MRRNQYANWAGVHTYPPEWSLTLKAVARLSFVLTFLVPGDVTVLHVLAKACGVQPGQGLAPMMWLALFLGHAMKWPPVVEHWATLIRERAHLDINALVDMFVQVNVGVIVS